MLPIIVAWLAYLAVGAIVFFTVTKLILLANQRIRHSDQPVDEPYTKTQNTLLLILAATLLVVTVLLATRFPQVGIWITNQYEFWRRLGTWLLVYVTLTTVPFSIFMIGCLIQSSRAYHPEKNHPVSNRSNTGLALLSLLVAVALIAATIVTAFAPLPW